MSTQRHPTPTPSGLLVVNKPSGPTSHDIVAQARRLFGTRAIGHAGTLDPMASGVLLLLVGEATKLSAALTLERKSYDATIDFGSATDSDDAQGKTIATVALSPGWLALERLESALVAERHRTEQIPPSVSAIKQAGVTAYKRHRRGESVELAPRPVRVHDLTLLEWNDARITVRLAVSKGYYVRSLARDLGAALGVPAHLTRLCRTSSGCFGIDEASSWPRDTAPPLLPLVEAARRVMPIRRLTEDGARRARLGQLVTGTDFAEAPAVEVAPSHVEAWVDAEGVLIALGRLEMDGTGRVVRGFCSQG